jgi:hypothetical protein
VDIQPRKNWEPKCLRESSVGIFTKNSAFLAAGASNADGLFFGFFKLSFDLTYRKRFLAIVTPGVYFLDFFFFSASGAHDLEKLADLNVI